MVHQSGSPRKRNNTMTVTLTSHLAFKETVSEREIQTLHLRRLYESVGVMSDREAGSRLGWYPSQVSARRNDLMKSGQVCELGRHRDPVTGKLVNLYGIQRETLF